MKVEFEKKPGLLTARLSGEIDHHTSRQIRKDIDDRLIECGAKTLELDFMAVSFMDSSGIGLVMGRYKLMSSLGGEIVVINTSPQIAKVMKLAGLSRIVTLQAKASEAD